MTTYDDIEALNWSTYKLVEVSPAYAKNRYDHPEENIDKEDYLQGRVIHCAILEPNQMALRYEIMPPFKGTGSVAARKEWRADLPLGVEVITKETWDMAMRCADYVSKHADIQRYFEGARFEQIAQWELDGVKCKGRMDALPDRVIDIKKTRQNTLRDIERDMAKYSYYAQVAWYHDGAARAGLISGDRLPALVFVHATPKSKFVDAAILDMDIEGGRGTFMLGQAKYKSMFDKYLACHKTNWWPGMAPRPRACILPEWKIREDEDLLRIEDIK